MRLVNNARSAWKWYSAQALAALTVVPLVWETLPAELRAYIPDTWNVWILSAVALGGLVGRMVDQGTSE